MLFSFRRNLPPLACGLLLCAAASHPARAQNERLPRVPVLSSPAGTTPQRYTFQTDESVREVLASLLDKQNVSYVIGPGVTGQVSVRFVDVPIDTVLARIAASVSPSLVITRAVDGAYLIQAGQTGPTQLSLSTPPATVTVNQAKPPQPISISVAGGDPVAVALELQIIALQVDREAAATQFTPKSIEIIQIDAKIAALKKQLGLHKAAKTGEKPVKTAQMTRAK